ncbi:hypothetical protein M422DRAFT_246422 [Sphaerobolus stellatus SS14]|nr:hypothetical protein M422DRAFT_246422 [Sphaerobolus stellatus SS14]
MLGRLKMTAEDALREYTKLLERIFSANNRKLIKSSEKGSYKASTLEATMKELIARSGFIGEEPMREDNQNEYGRVFVCALPLHNMRHVQRLRTYPVSKNDIPTCKIWEAARATTASPWVFKSIAISGLAEIKESLIDSGTRCNNPTELVVDEAEELFGSKCDVRLLLSIGSGHPQVIRFPESGVFEKILSKELLGLLKQIATDCEHVADRLHHHYINMPQLYFRMNVTHGAGMVNWEEWKKDSNVLSHTRSFLKDAIISAQVDSIVDCLCNKDMKIPNISLGILSGKLPLEVSTSSMSSTLVIGRTSSLSTMFVGQSNYIQRLKKHFTLSTNKSCSRQIFLLHEMGGIGKTQIALRFVLEASQPHLVHKYSHIFWIDGSSEDTMISSLKSIAEEAMPKDEKKDSVKDILHWMSTLSTPWLAIYDNADGSPLILEKYIPSENYGHILVTSRVQALARLASFPNSQEIETMSEEDSITLLLNAANIQSPSMQEEQRGKELVKTLGYLPLAVDMAGAYIQDRKWRFGKYLDLYSTQRSKLLDSELDQELYGHTVYGTWDLSFTWLKNKAKGGLVAAKTALLILEIVAFFHPQNISICIFEKAAQQFVAANINTTETGLPCVTQHLLKNEEYLHVHETENGRVWNDWLFNEGLRLLSTLAIIKNNGAQSSFTIHPIIHGYAYDKLATQDLWKLQRIARAILVVADNDIYSYRELLFPHIISNLRYVSKLKKEGEYEDDTFKVFSDILKECGDWTHWEDVINFQKEIIARRQNHLGEEHLNTLESITNLASTYYHQGQWTKAEELHLKVWKISRDKLGEAHTDTITGMANLASTYRHQGQWTEAEELELKVWQIRRDKLGEAHPDTITSMANLASTYWKQGQWTDAEELELKVWQIRRGKLGEAHPDTISSMANLASTYCSQGRWTEAEELQLNVWQMRRDKLGEAHLDTITSMANLASTYHHQGRWTEAEELELKVWQIWRDKLGETHPYTITTMANLASTYLNQGRWTEAEELQLKVWQIRRDKLGEAHPDTITNMANLASTYRHQGRWTETEELQLKVWQIRRDKLGEAHPDTITSMASLASTYRYQGRWTEAEELQLKVWQISRDKLGEAHPDTITGMEAEELELKVWQIRRDKLGEAHPDTITSMANLASTYWNQGRWTEAEELQLKVWQIRRDKLGEAHPDTITGMANLASTYHHQGRWTEAEELQLKVWQITRDKLGEAHPDTISSMANLAVTYCHQGRWTEAEELQFQVWQMRRDKLGEAHPDTISSIANLASAYWNQGQWTKAEKLQYLMWQIRRDKLGEAHPDTISTMANLASTYCSQGRWTEAEELQLKVWQMRRDKLGETHPDTITNMANLAVTYCNQSRWTEAEELQLKVWQMRRDKLGEAHPDTINSMANLAHTYQNQGQWTETEELQLKVLCLMSKKLGEDHPNTLTSMDNLANTYWKQNRFSEAEDLEVKVLQMRRDKLGEDHLYTLTSMEHLAIIYQSQGRLSEAAELEERVKTLMKEKENKEENEENVIV